MYAAYGGVYIFVAILWLWCVDGIKPTVWDIAGSLVALTGMAIIMFAKNSLIDYSNKCEGKSAKWYQSVASLMVF